MSKAKGKHVNVKQRHFKQKRFLQHDSLSCYINIFNLKKILAFKFLDKIYSSDSTQVY